MWQTRSLAQSVETFTLPKPALMSRKMVQTFNLGLWMVLTTWGRARQASEELRRKREPHWLGWSRPFNRARAESLIGITRSRIFDMALRRTMIWEEERES